ncbi:MAG: hypothetical protein ACOC1K_05580 [Nanoarchaeota archaeon]
MEDIYKLELNKSTRISVKTDGEYAVNYTVIRVPGGWLYRPSDVVNGHMVFVPFNNEFMT